MPRQHVQNTTEFSNESDTSPLRSQHWAPFSTPELLVFFGWRKRRALGSRMRWAPEIAPEWSGEFYPTNLSQLRVSEDKFVTLGNTSESRAPGKKAFAGRTKTKKN